MSIKWQESLTGLRLDLLSQNRSDSTIANRLCTSGVMARHATAAGLDPTDVTYEWLADYMLRQYQARKRGGPASCYADLRCFWTWYSAEFKVPNPMERIKRPKEVMADVPVLSEEQLKRLCLCGRCDPIWEPWWGYASAVLAPQMRITRTVLAGVALAVALVSAGCGSSGPSTHGPLRGGPFGSPSPGGAACLQARIGQHVAFGDENFTNHGHATLVLDRVGLRHPRHVHLIGSFAVPGTRGIGVARSWPPRYSGLPPSWKHRQRVHGFRLAPGKTFNMVLGVAATGGPPARSPGMAIYYHDSAGKYVVVDRFAMVVAVRGRKCD